MRIRAAALADPAPEDKPAGRTLTGHLAAHMSNLRETISRHCHLSNIYYNYWMSDTDGLVTEMTEKNVFGRLARRGAGWTAPIWLPLIIAMILNWFKTAQYYEQPASLLTIIDGIKSWSSALSLLAIFGTPLGLPIGAIFAGGAAGPRDAFKRGFFSVSAIVAADLLMLILSAFYFLIIPYRVLLPSEAVFEFWFAFSGAVGFSLFGGLGGLLRYKFRRR